MSNMDMATLTIEQRRLVGAWRDILGDIRHLCKSLKSLPDNCACRDGHEHLGGSCACCQTEHRNGVTACEDCNGLLAKLRPEMDTLTVDTWRFFPIVMDLLEPTDRETARATAPGPLERHIASVARQTAADAVERHIAGVVRTFERLVVAAEEFRVGCRVSHLRTLKSAATDLLADVERLDRAL
jgi:hypothetical protein